MLLERHMGDGSNKKWYNCILENNNSPGQTFYWKGVKIAEFDSNYNTVWNDFSLLVATAKAMVSKRRQTPTGKQRTRSIASKKEIIPAKDPKYQIRKKTYYTEYEGWEIEEYTIKKGRNGQAPMTIETRNPDANQRIPHDREEEIRSNWRQRRGRHSQSKNLGPSSYRSGN